LIRILQIFYKYGIYSLYLQEIAILVLTGGRAFAHPVGFLYELFGPTVRLFAAFPKENDKCPTLVTLPSLKIKEDIDPQSRKLLQMFEWWGVQTCRPTIKSL